MRAGKARLHATDVLLGLAVATSWWNGLVIPVFGHPTQVLILFALSAVGYDVYRERSSARLPGWLFVTAFLLLMVGIINEMFPYAPARTASDRVAESVTQALGVGPVDTGSNLANLVKLEIVLIVVPIAVSLGSLRSVRSLGFISEAWCVGALISAFVAILDGVAHAHIGTSLTHSALSSAYTGRQQGLSQQPNHLAVGCLIVMPVVAGWLVRPGLRWRQAGIVSLVILLVAIYLTGSRAALVAGPLALLVTCQVLPPLRPLGRGVLLWAVLAATVVAALRLVDLTGSTRIGSASALASDEARSIVRHIAVAQFTSRPLQGAGFTFYQDAHNIYLQILASSGVLGAIAFGVYLRGIVRVGLAALRSPARLAASALLLSLGLWLLLGLEENNLADTYLYVPVGLLMGLEAAYPPVSAGPTKVHPNSWGQESVGVVSPA